MAKMGRPLLQNTATRALEAKSKIRGLYPAVDALLELLDRGSQEDLASAERSMERALEELAQSPLSGTELSEGSSSPELQLLHTFDRIATLSSIAEVLASLKERLDGHLIAASRQLEAARADVLRLAVQREPLKQYAHDLIVELHAVGLTKATARSLSARQKEQIAAIIENKGGLSLANSKGANEGKTLSKRATAKAQGFDKALKHTNGVDGDNGEALGERAASGLWSDFPKKLPHYDLGRIAVGSDSTAREQQIAGMDLPPFLHLQDFGIDDLFKEFMAQIDPAEKAGKAWRICQRWYEEGPGNGAMMDTLHRQAWLFLLCSRHGFAHQVPELDLVHFPSPWKRGELVIATRTPWHKRPPSER